MSGHRWVNNDRLRAVEPSLKWIERVSASSGNLTWNYLILIPVRLCLGIKCHLELQIRGGIEDNSKIIFLMSQ